MKTYSPEVQYDYDGTYAGMTPCEDGEWVHLEDHLAVLAENALKMKRMEVKIEKLGMVVSQFVDLSQLPSDTADFSLLDGQFFYKKEGDEWMVYIAGAWFVSAAFKSGGLCQSDLISVEMLRV